MTVTVKGSDWFPESTVGNITVYYEAQTRKRAYQGGRLFH